MKHAHCKTGLLATFTSVLTLDHPLKPNHVIYSKQIFYDRVACSICFCLDYPLKPYHVKYSKQIF